MSRSTSCSWTDLLEYYRRVPQFNVDKSFLHVELCSESPSKTTASKGRADVIEGNESSATVTAHSGSTVTALPSDLPDNGVDNVVTASCATSELQQESTEERNVSLMQQRLRQALTQLNV